MNQMVAYNAWPGNLASKQKAKNVQTFLKKLLTVSCASGIFVAHTATP